MSEVINRMNDFYFKYLMGSEKNKPLALDFINAALANEQGYFTDIIYVDKDEDPKHKGDKQSRLDIKGKLNNGSIIDLEMQALTDKDMSERSLYYWARIYGDVVKAGEEFAMLKPAICVNVLGFEHLEEANWRNEYWVLNIESKRQLSNHLQIVFLELPKLQTKNVTNMNKLDLWGAYFSRKLKDEELKEVEIMAEALKAELEFTADEKLRWEYEQRERFFMEQRSRESRAKREGKREEHEANLHKDIKRIRNMMGKLKITASEAMDILGMSSEEQEEYLKLLEHCYFK